MKRSKSISMVWSLLTRSERKKSIFLVLYLLIGAGLELLSVGILIPLIEVLTQSNLRARYPIFETYFPNFSDQLIVITVLISVVLIFLLKEIFLGFSLWAQRGYVAKLETRFQTELFSRYLYNRYDFHLTQNSSFLMRNILNSNNFIDNVIDPLFILLTDGFVALLLCTALILIDPLSMALTIGLVSMVAIAFHKFSKTRIEIWGVERQKMQSIRIQQINETFGGIKEVTLLGRDRFFKQKFESNINQLSRINRKFSTIIVIPRLYLELLSITGLAVLVTSMLAMGRTPNSMLPILGLFAGGAFRLMPAINRITFAFQSFRMGGPVIQLMTDHMNQKPIDQIGTTVHPSIEFQKSIQFKSLTYKYEGSDDPALEDLSFEIIKGSEIGIIGSTGAGKSTFVDVLLGLLSPTSGQVLVDGIDISRQVRGWQDLIGYVPQTIFLTDSSIEANIALGIVEDEIDYSKIDRALELAQLKTFVETLPNGKKTMVGERGVRLSGGQRQRIGIARALYNDPPILVFDEATSALDEETEMEILVGLKKLSGRKTTIMITHRSAALINCKQIYEIADGGIRLAIVDK